MINEILKKEHRWYHWYDAYRETALGDECLKGSREHSWPQSKVREKRKRKNIGKQQKKEK